MNLILSTPLVSKQEEKEYNSMIMVTFIMLIGTLTTLVLSSVYLTYRFN